jgi:ABC-type molybdenum transport system ATPase subunit/photorepair protein PhrA
MPTSADRPDLTPWDQLRARLTPGALLFSLADPAQAEQLRQDLPAEGLAWVGWSQREALLREGRYSAQERYSSMGGRDAPPLGDWLAPSFSRWRSGPQGVAKPVVAWARLDRALRLCQLDALAERPVSVLSNGEAARACVARALGAQPACLVLDDLCEGLDGAGRAMLMDLGRDLAAEGAAVAILASRPSLLPWTGPGEGQPGPAEPPGDGPLLFTTRGLDLDAGDQPLIRGLEWSLRGGEAWWVQGPNGAGKSSLLAFLSGEHPQAWAKPWSLLGQGRDAYTPLDALRRQVAWVSPELAAALRRPIQALLDQALRSPARLLLLDEPLRGLHSGEADAWHARLSLALRGPDAPALAMVSHDPDEAPPGHTHTLRLLGHGLWGMG